jgi:hypothetical protein
MASGVSTVVADVAGGCEDVEEDDDPEEELEEEPEACAFAVVGSVTATSAATTNGGRECARVIHNARAKSSPAQIFRWRWRESGSIVLHAHRQLYLRLQLPRPDLPIHPGSLADVPDFPACPSPFPVGRHAHPRGHDHR